MNPVCRITGEGRAEFLRTWRPDFDQNTRDYERTGWDQSIRRVVSTFMLAIFVGFNSRAR